MAQLPCSPLLDAYYLAHERAFRNLYEKAITREHVTWSLKADRVGASEIVAAIRSFAVWPLYLILATGSLLVAIGV